MDRSPASAAGEEAAHGKLALFPPDGQFAFDFSFDNLAEPQPGAAGSAAGPSAMQGTGNPSAPEYDGNVDPSSSTANPVKVKAKRTRLALSCNRCRVRKIKCTTERPLCGPCKAAGEEYCVFEKPTTKPKASPGESSSCEPPSQRRKHESTEHNSAQLAHIFKNHDDNMSQADALLQLGSGSDVQQGSVFAHPASSAPFNMPTSTSTGSHVSPASTLEARARDEGLLHTFEHRRKFVGAASNQALIKWLDQDSTSRPLGGHFQYGVPHAEEFTFPGLDNPWEQLPPEPQLTRYLNAYFEHAHPVHPCLDEKAVREYFAVQAASPMIPPSGPDTTPPLFWLVVSIGADSDNPDRRATAVGDRYLRLAWKSIPSIMARPYRTAVQTCIMIAHALRSRNKDGAAWNIIAQAVRIAQSLGLHLQHTSANLALDARIWWSAYVLEKILSFDVGRPSAINDLDCTIPLEAIQANPTADDPKDLRPFRALAGLSQQMSRISTDLFSRNVWQVTEKDRIRKVGECDARLLKWLEGVPGDLRPTGEPPIPGPLLGPVACLHLTYYQTQIILHRLALFDNVGAITACLADPTFQPYVSRLSASKSICVNAARSILGVQDVLQKQYPSCRHWSLHCVLTAIFVIAIQTYKHPASWQANSDLQLLGHACEYAMEHYFMSGFEKGFVELLPALHKKVEAKVRNPHAASRAPSRPASPNGENARPDTAQGPPSSDKNSGQTQNHNNSNLTGGTAFDNNQGLQDFFVPGGLNDAPSIMPDHTFAGLEDFSPWLFGDGGSVYAELTQGQNLTDMFGDASHELFQGARFM